MRYASTILYVPDIAAAVDFYGRASVSSRAYVRDLNGTLVELGEPVSAV